MAERRDSGRRRGPSTPEADAARAPATVRSDPRVAKLARAVGNDALRARFAAGEACRDELLAHVVERLRDIRELQRREVDLCHRGSSFPWWRTVADPGKAEFTSPEPTRWHEAARRYDRAAERLCQGDLRRGRALLDDAHEAERRAREALTALVDAHDVGAPGALPELPAATEVTGACDPPPGLSLAREILSVTTESPEIPHRKRGRDPWWTLDEDEEDEEEPGAPGGP